MAKVFRVQDVSGRGPWRPGFSRVWSRDDLPKDVESLPPIHVDFQSIPPQKKGRHRAVGCMSVQQLRRWILPEEWETLRGHGFRCVMFDDAKIVCKSNVQAIIERRRPFTEGFREVRFYLAHH